MSGELTAVRRPILAAQLDRFVENDFPSMSTIILCTSK